ncbi:MAG: hypothetical protein LBV47_08950, partial [Bacteroidales bacterium]|nr:hypothetical protein [Bacteroidales bacterium]
MNAITHINTVPQLRSNIAPDVIFDVFNTPPLTHILSVNYNNIHQAVANGFTACNHWRFTFGRGLYPVSSRDVLQWQT